MKQMGSEIIYFLTYYMKIFPEIAENRNQNWLHRKWDLVVINISCQLNKAFCNKYQMGFNYILWYILEKIIKTDCWRYNPYHPCQFSCISVGFLSCKSQFIFSLYSRAPVEFWKQILSQELLLLLHLMICTE